MDALLKITFNSYFESTLWGTQAPRYSDCFWRAKFSQVEPHALLTDLNASGEAEEVVISSKNYFMLNLQQTQQLLMYFSYLQITCLWWLLANSH